MRLLDYKRLVLSDGVEIADDVQYFGDGAVHIGAGSRIDAGCILFGDLVIGHHSHIAPYCLLYGKYGISLGDLCNLGAMCVLHTENDHHRSRITLEGGVTVGTHCTLMPGVWFAKGSMVGAHSLVWAEFNGGRYERGVYAGTPAKLVRQPHMHALELAKEVL